MEKKVIILTAYAGHGKDFALEQIKKIDKNYKKIAFADKFKEIIAKNLPNKVLSNFSDKMSPIEIVNELKDNRPDILISGNLNMRDFLRKMLGDTIREIEPDIHCLYTIKDIEKNLVKNPNTKFVCTDNRYVNEQDYLIQINQYKNTSDILDFIRCSIKEKADSIDIIKADKIFDKHFPEKDKFLKDIRTDFLKSINDLKMTEKPRDSFSILKIKNINLNNETLNSAFNKYGVVGIFRPLIPTDKNPTTKKELFKEINKFTGLNFDEIEKIKEKYEKNCELSFNLDNIKKYGFIRTSPFHLSESSLEAANRKPSSVILNIPDKTGTNLYNKILDLLNNETLGLNLDNTGKKKTLKK